MQLRKGKVAALWTGAVAVGVLAVAGYFAWPRILERYYIWRLHSTHEIARLNAARKLAELESLAAVPHLVESIRKEKRENWSSHPPSAPDGIGLTPLAYALYRIGVVAPPQLIWDMVMQAERGANPPRAARADSDELSSILQVIRSAWQSKKRVVELSYAQTRAIQQGEIRDIKLIGGSSRWHQNLDGR